MRTKPKHYQTISMQPADLDMWAGDTVYVISDKATYTMTSLGTIVKLETVKDNNEKRE